MSKPQETNPATPQRTSSKSEMWNLLIRGLLAMIVITVVAPRVIAEFQAARSGEREKAGKAAAEKAEGADPRAASAAEAGAWRPLSGGGGGGFSASDVMACNRAAQAARKNPSQKLPSDLAAAMSAGKGSLVGATADSLKRVNIRARDDARAANVYEACIFERTF
jgi:flagellar biosynthesis/type III secretory pathway M-ring protein FliF/YscJ